MSFLGFLRLFSAGTPEAGPGGHMALGDHFRELRARLLRSLFVMLICLIVAFFFYDHLLALVLNPYNDARRSLGSRVNTEAYIQGATGPFMLNLKICGITAILVSSPYWLYQIWAFILPGLHAHERRWTRVFVGVAGPLFLAGAALGYYVMPKGLQVLIGFTPSSLQSLLEFNEYLSFLTGMLLIFGISFEIPLFVILLNLAGVVTGAQLARYRSFIIVGVFIFAAVATPSTDPYSMTVLAVPMSLLFVLSEVIARMLDRRRGRNAAATAVDDDAASAL